MSDNRWPNDNTRFRVEARDFDFIALLVEDTGRGDSTENWKVVGNTYNYDTFPQAVAEAQKQGEVYRELRIVRTVDTVVAYFKDGAESE